MLKLEDVGLIIPLTWYKDLSKRGAVAPNTDMQSIKPCSHWILILSTSYMRLKNGRKPESCIGYRVAFTDQKDDGAQMATIQSILGTKARRVLKT